jgi:wyosine [tRNA(Phe)-imidazoG37] synthetase (radical SAM superfamily)
MDTPQPEGCHSLTPRRRVELPLLPAAEAACAGPQEPSADTSQDEEYDSCEWIEGGIAFNRRSLHTCLIAHHRTGLPFIADYAGGPLPLDRVLAVRDQIRAANRRGGHPECKGCAHLKRRRWPARRHAIEIVGIAHYSYCNIQCNYCFLQTQDPASFADGYKPYPLLPTLRALIADGLLSPDAIIDWGGGEPTYYKEFDELLALLLAHGTRHYLHTNGTRLPRGVRSSSTPERIHVICSVDAGFPATYLRMKKRDYLERVWNNLEEYIRLGVKVTLKYIVKQENGADAELRAFVERAVRIGGRELIIDIDYDFPHPSEEVVVALARLKHLACRAGLHTRYGFTGDNFAAENNVAARVRAAFQAELLQAITRLLQERNYASGEAIDMAVEDLVGGLEAHCAAKDQALLEKEQALRTLEAHCAARGQALLEKEQVIQEKEQVLQNWAAALRQLERPGVLLRRTAGLLLGKLRPRKARAS